MGMVYQSEDMQKEADEMQKRIDDILEKVDYRVMSTDINATTEMSVRIRPLSYDVVLGGKNIVSLNNVENAITIYHAMMADFKGDIYHG